MWCVFGLYTGVSGAGFFSTGGSGILPESPAIWIALQARAPLHVLLLWRGDDVASAAHSSEGRWELQMCAVSVSPHHTHTPAGDTLDAEAQTVTPNRLSGFGPVPLAFPQALAT